MVIRDQRHADVSKQTTLLDGVDIGPPKLRVVGRGLNPFTHEGMNDISNLKVHQVREVAKYTNATKPTNC